MIKEQIDSFHLEDIKNDLHPSVFFKNDNYDLFILRIPQLCEGQVVFTSKAFVMTNESYYYYNKDEGKFVDLTNFRGFYKVLDKYIDATLKMILKYLDEIETIEDLFNEGKSVKDFNHQWFSYKNDSVKTNRILFKAVETLADLIFIYKQEDDYLEQHFEDIQEHLQRAYRNSGLLLEKLDALKTFNMTKNNEQMNQTIYILTLLSGIFLPLNLIVGFFGMNTTSLPFTVGDGGTYNVITLLILTAVVTSFLTIIYKNLKND